MLEIENISVSFKNKQVLKSVTLYIKQGEVIGLLGKNGAGKTTLFEALYRNIKHEGNIQFNDIALDRKWVSYLESENYFYPYITGAEYLEYFAKNKEDKKQELVSKFQLPLEKFVQYYSTGMKKKIALIGMLMLDKPIAILDEPFNGVDFEGVHLLYDVIKELRSENKIVIISSHIIETLFHTCDKIAILKDGVIDKIINKNQFSSLEHFKF
ncbi:ATP-binding cassette domain-containing protein [Chryseobacterium sp.]|uniref:ABC transporter ATP-binding protein n=1 Tax=Chryseobacterium sp. TaxID=1871047 RepID=UPI003890FE6B